MLSHIGDILVFTKTWKDNITHLHSVLEAANLTINRKKSQLGHISVQYLGFNIGDGYIWAVQDKPEALARAITPTTCQEL